jgi:ATP-dependent Clp protease adaptor protein ClpS
MTNQISNSTSLPDVEEKSKVKKRARPIHLPQYHVVLLDDNDHTYDYVIEMLMDIFRHSAQTAFEMACEVDASGRVVVDTTTKERAELKRDQIHAYGPDWRIPHCVGSMSAIIEPAESDSEE